MPGVHASSSQRVSGAALGTLRMDRDITNGRHAPVTLAVVDDSPAFRRAICMSLSRDPRVKLVGAAEDGRAALELVKGRSPDVALVDMRMPGMDGADLTRA